MLPLFLAVALHAGAGDFKTPDGVRLHYRIAGNSSRVMVLLHGGPGSNMNAVYPDLEPLSKYYTIIMYDQRGAGRSDIMADPKRLTAADHVRDLAALVAHFRLQHFVLTGESWGSALAALYASEHPEHISKIVFLGPMPPTKELSKQRFATDPDFTKRMASIRADMPSARDPIALCHEFFAAYLRSYFVDRAAMKARRGDSCNSAPDGVRNYFVVNEATIASLGDWDFRPILAKLRVPALVIEGAESKPTVASAKAWADALPNGKLILIPKAGHFPQVERASEFFAAVHEFLR